MPRNTTSQLTGLPTPRSPASALNNAAAAAAMSAGFNAAYAASAGQLNYQDQHVNLQLRNLRSSYPQPNACHKEKMSAFDSSSSQVLCYVYNGINYAIAWVLFIFLFSPESYINYVWF